MKNLTTKSLGALLICILMIFTSCSKEEVADLKTQKVPVAFSFDGLDVSETDLTTRAAMSTASAPDKVFYLITEASTGKVAIQGECQRTEGLTLELLPGDYNCKFACMENLKSPLLITDLNSQHFYGAEQGLKVLETGAQANVVLKRFVSAVEIVKSDGLKLLPWVSLKASITSPTSFDLAAGTFATATKWPAVTGDNNFNFLFPAENVKIEVTIHSDLTNMDYDKYFRIVKVSPNKKYKVIVKLLSGGNDGSNLGGAKISFDIVEDWDGSETI